MSITRDTVFNALLALVVVACGAWVVRSTEWADETVRIPAQGEAARDRLYAFKRILTRLGVQVVSPQNLDRLPPPGATLVLSSWDWDLFPEREQALRRWVESGGHLVAQGLKRPAWIPIEQKNVPAPSRGKPASAPAALPGATPRLAQACRDVVEPDAVTPAFPPRRSYRLCNAGFGIYLKTQAPVLWSLDSESGPAFLRVPLGRGRVTTSVANTINNRDILDGDNALVYTAALQLHPGDAVWFVDSETRAPLLTTIWRSGAPAVLLGALALALALWRAAVRFGPRAPVPPLARRSVAEQIRGTANFIFQRDSAALHRAQLRTLEQSARRMVRDHDRLERRARAEAIAKATALDADDLARAMDPSLKRSRRDLLAVLTLLETAARRLTLNR